MPVGVGVLCITFWYNFVLVSNFVHQSNFYVEVCYLNFWFEDVSVNSFHFLLETIGVHCSSCIRICCRFF